jgi:hypothetical protein
MMAQSRQKDHAVMKQDAEKLVFTASTAESRVQTDWNRTENILPF